MTRLSDLAIARRDLLKGSGALVVSLSAPALVGGGRAEAAISPVAGKPGLTPDQLDSWVAVRADGRITAYFGKMDMGQGVDVAIAQIVAEELDVPFDRVDVVMGDTAWTVNQGGASGSTGLLLGAIPLRNAAAEARRVLVEMAAEKLEVPAGRLRVVDGVIGDGTKKVSYAELIGGRYFNVPMTWNGKWGNRLAAVGKAKPKKASEYSTVGKNYPRFDVPGKVFGTTDFVTDVRLPGMLHGRMIRPAVAGAVPVGVDAGSIRDIPGARIVREKDLIAVVAEKEWDAIRAAQKLKVTWSDAPAPFPSQDKLYDHIRNAPAVARKSPVKTGDVDKALGAAARVIEAEYEWPFQSHASMGPACAVCEVKDGKATLWTGSQKPHYGRDGVAAILGLPPDDVRGIWVPGPGSYGRNDAGDAAMDAAVLARATGRPVRVQYMRHEGHGWDPKAPASIHRVRAGLDAKGNVIAYDFLSRAFPRLDVASNESNPSDTLAGRLLGHPDKTNYVFGNPAESYDFANKRHRFEVIRPLLSGASPLRTSHLRDPLGPQIQFASESFVDELAQAVGADPVEFRLRLVKDSRDGAVIRAAAEKAGWKPRPRPHRNGGNGTVTGRGIAYAQRNGSTVAVVAEVDVDRASGRVWGRRFVVAHDCGLVVNPGELHRVIEGNIVQGLSRALYEEVTFDERSVTSVDWVGYPILESPDVPLSIEIVLLDRREMPPKGAGEPSTRPVAGAIANAIFDATGVRIRRAPFTPDRIKGALRQT
jgi:CO/xanthine dehydrogenase Mo-binding subunit